MKRSTLRAAALVACVLAFGMLTRLPARPDDSVRPVIQAQGNPSLVDFIALLSRRADLRVSVARDGLDAAFTDWLKVERPDAYTAARKSSVTAAAVQTVRDGKTASCCTSVASCCASSPAASCCGASCCRSSCCNATSGK